MTPVTEITQAHIDAALGRIGDEFPEEANLIRAALAANRADIDLWELADRLDRLGVNLATLQARLHEVRMMMRVSGSDLFSRWVTSTQLHCGTFESKSMTCGLSS